MPRKERNIEEKLWCMKRKIWAIIIFSLQSLILIIMLGCFGSENWVQQGTGSAKWSGGLLRVTGGNSEMQEVEYIDMAASCTNLLPPCGVFKGLRDAGATFCFFEVISYCLTVVWMVKVAFMILQKSVIEQIPCMVWPGAGLFCHILAEIIWSGVTGAKFMGSCDDATSSNLCSTDGPAGVLAITVIYIATFVIFIIFYMKRLIPETGHKEETEHQIDLDRKP